MGQQRDGGKARGRQGGTPHVIHTTPSASIKKEVSFVQNQAKRYKQIGRRDAPLVKAEAGDQRVVPLHVDEMRE